MRKIYMNRVYYYICYRYLNGKKDRSIANLEQILFLMQYESIKTNDKPFLKYEIYIYDGEIRIRYLSDLLRVSPILMFGNEFIHSDKKMKQYQKKLREYSLLSENDLKERVKLIINNEDLDKKHFVFEKYEDKRMRRAARLRITEENRNTTLTWGLLAGFTLRKALGICICIFAILINGLFLISFLISGEARYFQGSMVLIVLTIIFFIIPYTIWTYLWSKPTKYEIENGYLNE